MNDRELLELAAKTAGIELWHEDVFTNGLTQKVSDNGVLRWNPLQDDGDALRLAVKLGLLGAPYMPLEWIAALGDADPCAATRRAIVRAAAEIGRQS